MKRTKGGFQLELAEIVRTSDGPGPCVFVDGYRKRPVAICPISIGRKVRAASRVVWIMANGDPGDDVWVLHTCGKGQEGCLRLGHLYLGDHAQNMVDMAADGTVKGVRNPRAKLTEHGVWFARLAYATGEASSPEIARILGVSKPVVLGVIHGRLWSHVTTREYR